MPKITENDLLNELEANNNNTSPRMPILFLIDTSYSMTKMYKNGQKRIDVVNQNLKEFFRVFSKNLYTRDGIEIGLITFSDKVNVELDFEPIMSAVNQFSEIHASGGETKLGEAINTGLELLDNKLSFYRNFNINHYKPSLVIMTDGEATDTTTLKHSSEKVLKRVAIPNAKEGLKLFFLAIGDEECEKTFDMFNKNDKAHLYTNLDVYQFMDSFSRSVSSQSRIAYSDEGFD